MAANAQCTKHTLACPTTCWKVGLTALSIFDGKLAHARTFTTVEALNTRLDYERAHMVSQVDEYVRLKLPVPPQYSKWTFVAWDGTNAPA